jgi:hypothetical protein
MRQAKYGNPITWESWKSDPERNRVPRVVGPAGRGCKNIRVMNMKGSDLFNGGKKTGKETGEIAKQTFAKGEASGQKQKEKGKDAGISVSV